MWAKYHRFCSFRSLPFLLCFLLPLSLSAGSVVKQATRQDASQEEPTWLGFGGGIYNNRWMQSASPLDSTTASSLIPQCHFDTFPGPSTVPLVLNGTAYFPTWGGDLVALKYSTCEVIWQTDLSAIIQNFDRSGTTGSALGKASRTTPVTDGEVLYLGTQSKCLLLAIDIHTGAFLDALELHTHPWAIVTQSPTIYNGVIYSGVSSMEEATILFDTTWVCCSFKATMNAVVFQDGKLQFLWTQWMIPQSLSGWAGSSIWGSQPSIQASRSQLFIATGNTYDIPGLDNACQLLSLQHYLASANELLTDPCIPAHVYQESILALDLATGNINWVRHLGALDVWTEECALDPLSLGCDILGSDYDFGIAPTFIPASVGNTPLGVDIVVASQKSGYIFALRADNGDVLWHSNAAPGGLTGGIMWGIAVDDTAVYYTSANSGRVEYKLQLNGSDPSSVETIANSAFGALRLSDGKSLWQQPVPRNASSYIAPTVVNDVVMTGVTGDWVNGTIEPTGTLVLLDKATGAVVGEYPINDIFERGAVPVGDYLLVVSGNSVGLGDAVDTFTVYAVEEQA